MSANYETYLTDVELFIKLYANVEKLHRFFEFLLPLSGYRGIIYIFLCKNNKKA